jgi:hypothetical protein
MGDAPGRQSCSDHAERGHRAPRDCRPLHAGHTGPPRSVRRRAVSVGLVLHREWSARMGTLHLLSESSTSSERHVVGFPFFRPPHRHACLPFWCPSWRAVLMSRVSESIPWTRDGPTLPGFVWTPPAQRTSNGTTVIVGSRPPLESSNWMADRVIVPTQSSAMSSTECYAGRMPAWTLGRRASIGRLPHSSLCFDWRSSGGPEVRVVGENRKMWL